MFAQKRRHYARAKEHLESGDDARLPCAALELRFCLEAIVYSKLRLYEKRLPVAIKRKWQPPQALKALLQIEPDADRDFTLRVAREKEYGVPGDDWRNMGTHRTVKLKWLRKEYNRLGSYLHLDQPFTPPRLPYQIELQKMREDLQGILDHLAPIVASTLDAGLAPVAGFECIACGSQVLCNEDGLEKTGTATCLDADCEAEHGARRAEDGEWVFSLPHVTVQCQDCKASIDIESRRIRFGLEVNCAECNAEYKIKWAFVKEADGTRGDQE